MIANSKRRVKRRNEMRIYRLLQARQAMSRKRIAEALELTPASITQLTGGMLEAGLLQEVGTMTRTKATAGPKETLIDINETYRYLIGVDIEMNMVSVGLVTLKGRPLYRRSFKINLVDVATEAVATLISKITSIVHVLLKKAELKISDIACCGIGMVGREYYYQTRGLPIPPLLKAKQKIIDGLSDKLGIPVVFGNNVRALASAEANFYPQAARSFLFVKVGPGIGSAIVLDRKLYRGEQQQAGEIGSAIVEEFYPQFSDVNGQPLSLEDIFSFPFVKAELTKLGHWLPETADIGMVYHLLRQKDPDVVTIYSQKMRILANRLNDYTSLLDLQRVYLYLGSDMPPQLFDLLKQALPSTFIRAKRLVMLSHIDKQRAFIGGAGIAYSETMQWLSTVDQDFSELN